MRRSDSTRLSWEMNASIMHVSEGSVCRYLAWGIVVKKWLRSCSLAVSSSKFFGSRAKKPNLETELQRILYLSISFCRLLFYFYWHLGESWQRWDPCRVPSYRWTSKELASAVRYTDDKFEIVFWRYVVIVFCICEAILFNTGSSPHGATGKPATLGRGVYDTSFVSKLVVNSIQSLFSRSWKQTQRKPWLYAQILPSV